MQRKKYFSIWVVVGFFHLSNILKPPHRLYSCYCCWLYYVVLLIAAAAAVWDIHTRKFPHWKCQSVREIEGKNKSKSDNLNSALG